MIAFIQKIKRILFSMTTKTVPAGHVDHSKFEQQIDHYRNLGSRIGKKVRLLGRIDGVNPHLISIGDYSVIGAQSALLAHCPINGSQPCKVGNYVYIAFGALILPGVTVGDHSVIGAGAVVTRDVPEGTIVAGNPAKVIRVLTETEKDNMQEIMFNDRLFGWDGK